MTDNGLDITLDAKVRYLGSPEAYIERPTRVEHIETHFAHVFLTDRYAYKLKKPIRFHAVDFSTLELRRRTCESELALNRRLAEAVYLDVVPLSADARGLALEARGRGTVVDWLVKMHRLPRERMLDARINAGDVSDAELRALVSKLAEFYAGAARAPWTGAEYRDRIERELRVAASDFAARGDELYDTSTAQLVEEQLELVDALATTLERRCAAGRIVDAHGDLRPEHVFLDEVPQIIDCLEFSAELRLLDTAEEIAFLALECAEIGGRDLSARLVSLYETDCSDPLPRTLLELYWSRRALARARSCAWHLDEPLSDTRRAHWIRRAKRYLAAASAAVERARTG